MRVAKTLTMLLFAILSATFIFLTTKPSANQSNPRVFNENRSYQDIVYQMSLGPRILGSIAHQKAGEYISNELTENGWRLIIQESNISSEVAIKNIIGVKGEGRPWIILGAHYDSRLRADKDPNPEMRLQPVPGANDGGSGTAVLLELARVLPDDLDKQIWLCFFDAEDNGNLDGYDWIMGSTFFVDNLTEYPDYAIIIDMVGDLDLNIYLERNSNAQLANDIWETAANLGKTQFHNELKYSILDDHIPFLEVGIPAIDIIDFDYAYWHTTMDTIDKVSQDSLLAVGETLYDWIIR